MIAFAHGHGFLTYLWHYLLARLIYDDLVRPLTRGEGAAIAVAVGTAIAVALLIHGRRRRGRA